MGPTTRNACSRRACILRREAPRTPSALTVTRREGEVCATDTTDVVCYRHNLPRFRSLLRAMSWFFSHWLGGGGDGGGGGAGSRRGEMRGAGEAFSSSSPPSSTSQIKMGDYDLRTCVSSSGGLLSGGTPQQHALVQLKCAIQVRGPRPTPQ